MSDRKVLAVLIKAGDTALDRPLGVGGLVNENVALVVLDEKAELGGLVELEVLITPVPLGKGEEVERIRPTRLMVAKLPGAGETVAAMRLAHPSRYLPTCPLFARTALVEAVEAENDIWRGVQRVSSLGDRMPEVEVTEALENARAAEESYQALNFRALEELTAREMVANCFINCGDTCRQPAPA